MDCDDRHIIKEKKQILFPLIAIPLSSIALCFAHLALALVGSFFLFKNSNDLEEMLCCCKFKEVLLPDRCRLNVSSLDAHLDG